MAEGGGVAPPSEAIRGRGKGTMTSAIAIVVAIIAFLAGLGAGYFIYSTPAAKAKLTVATNVPFPPFESYNDTLGRFVGFDIDIASLIANATGRQLVVRNFDNFDLLLTTVGNGGVDMAASGITMSGTQGAKRNLTMSFSNPYYNANQAVITLAGDTTTCPNNVCDQSELGNKTIGVQSGTTSEGWVDTNIKPFDPNNATDIHRYGSVTTELQELKNGVYEFMIIDAGPAANIVSGSSSTLKLLGTIITNELYGFAVAKGDPQSLVPSINTVLAQIKASGVYDQLLAKWFK